MTTATLSKPFTPLSIHFLGHVASAPAIMLIPTMVGFSYGFVASLIWLRRDAERRGKNPAHALLFLLTTGWPLSLLWWLWLRPKKRNYHFGEMARGRDQGRWALPATQEPVFVLFSTPRLTPRRIKALSPVPCLQIMDREIP
jgi:hypothetical protein